MSSEQLVLAATGLLSAMSLAVVALWRAVNGAQQAHITTLERQLVICQEEKEAWRQAAFDALPIMRASTEGLMTAVGLAKRRGPA